MAIIQTVSSSGLADVTVYVAEHQGLADLLVCVVSSPGLAHGEDGLWFFTEQSGVATSRVHCVTSQGGAGCYVDHQGLAGWRRSHALQGGL